MQNRLLASLMFGCLVLAGCASGPGTQSLAEAMPSEPLSLLAEGRGEGVTVMIHETADEEAVALEQIEGTHAWEARDVPLSFHGIQEVYDEWGRAIPAFVFRYRPMQLEIDSVEFLNNEVEITGHYEPAYLEYAFDASDGRFLGPLDIDGTFRYFSAPASRDALVWGLEGPLFLFMTAYVQGDRLGEPVPIGDDLNLSLQPYDGWRPFDGDCQAYNAIVESSESRDANDEEDEPYLMLVCLDDRSPIARWAWAGQQDKGGVGYQRLGDGIALPPLTGTPLPPAPHVAVPFEPGPVPLLGDFNPVHSPASDGGGDWADLMAQRLIGLYTDPDFVAYAADKPWLYLSGIAAGWPPALPLFLGVLPVRDPLFDDSAWIDTTGGSGFYWAFIKSRWEIEQPDLHVMERPGADFTFSEWPFPDLDEVHAAPIGTVVGGLPTIAPEAVQGLQFTVFPLIVDDLPLIMYWIGYGSCFTALTKPSQVAGIDALDGAVYAAGLGVSTPNGCSSALGGMSSYLTGNNPTLEVRPVRDGLRHGLLHKQGDGASYVVWNDGVEVLGTPQAVWPIQPS